MDKKHPNGFHPNNPHKGKYPFEKLASADSELLPFLMKKKDGSPIIDFANPASVRALNRAILRSNYGLRYWDFPDKFLCPAIPGRVDYVHYLSDLLETPAKAEIIDIGTGASSIYAVLITSIFNWSVTGTDINPEAIRSARTIAAQNLKLSNRLNYIEQADSDRILEGIIHQHDYYDATICNPPFFESSDQANKANRSKTEQHKSRDIFYSENNKTFAGVQDELYCRGGEKQFIRTLIKESVTFAKNVKWFTTLISKQSTLNVILPELEKRNPKSLEVIPMQHGNKRTRILAWSYQN